MRGIPEKDTQGRSRGEFVGSSGGEIGVAATPEDTEVVIRGWRPVEHHVWGGEVECLGGKNVKEEGCGGKSLNPIGWGDTGLKQEGTNNIIDGTNNAFSFTVLRRGIRTGHPELDAVGEEEGMGSMIVELASIIALNTLNGDTKLRSHIGKEIRQGRKSVRL